MSRFDSLGSYMGFPPLAYQHAETITYTPKGQAAQEIEAVVIREQLGTRGTDRGARLEYEVSIIVSRSALSRPNVNGDTAAVIKRLGDSDPITMRVARIIADDGGQWVLGLN